MKISLITVVASTFVAGAAYAVPVDVVVQGEGPGRTFEGIGALSAGASSRLLIDYPEPQRREILDYLFKPDFGAAFQHLKVEIGGEVNSTDGTEATHMRTRTDTNYDRGYEWWLMEQAKARNPNICLDSLAWGAPGWIGGGKYYSQDMADYVVNFLQGAKKVHGLDIAFTGIWNETPHDTAWIKRLRHTLDQAGLTNVGIVAADDYVDDGWKIVNEMESDAELRAAVARVGEHYRGTKSPANAQTIGCPLWMSEDGPWRGDWTGATVLARAFNRNYITGKYTKTIIWSLVSSYYDTLPLADSGPMLAKEPWSGHYEVQPAIWAIAHTTQFAQPGWHYLDGGCGLLEGGSYVTLRSPEPAADYSVVLETTEAKEAQTIQFHVRGLSKKKLHVWRTNEKVQFEQLPDLSSADGTFSMALEPGAIYSLTTTTGQHKGRHRSPPAAEFPLPYTDNFESYRVGKYAHYFSDQGGMFEVARRPDGQGRCLRQVLEKNGIDWPYHPTSEPCSWIGSAHWRDYEVKVSALIETTGSASVWGRIQSFPQSAQPAKGYWLKVTQNGQWQLMAFTNILASGRVPFAAQQWHDLTLRFSGPTITALIDHVTVQTVRNHSFSHGLAAIGTGWNPALFDDFAVRPVAGSASGNLALGKQLTASSQWSDDYTAAKANDDNPDTRWNAAAGKALGEWLELDFGRPTRFDTVHIVQFGQRITRSRLEAWDGARWTEIITGGSADQDDWTWSFPAVEARKLRLVVLEVNGVPAQTTPSIHELEVFLDGGGATSR